jgi:hypothetical protein
MKNPPRQRGGGLKTHLSASDSLAVFYVEQVALNRHVSSEKSIGCRGRGVKEFPLPLAQCFPVDFCSVGWQVAPSSKSKNTRQ